MKPPTRFRIFSGREFSNINFHFAMETCHVWQTTPNFVTIFMATNILASMCNMGAVDLSYLPQNVLQESVMQWTALQRNTTVWKLLMWSMVTAPNFFNSRYNYVTWLVLCDVITFTFIQSPRIFCLVGVSCVTFYFYRTSVILLLEISLWRCAAYLRQQSPWQKHSGAEISLVRSKWWNCFLVDIPHTGFAHRR